MALPATDSAESESDSEAGRGGTIKVAEANVTKDGLLPKGQGGKL